MQCSRLPAFPSAPPISISVTWSKWAAQSLVDDYGVESPLSSAVQAHPSAAPSAPTGLGATNGNGEVVLDWNDNAEGDFDHYDVYRATSAKEIAHLKPLYAKYMTCCVDIDRSALNTFGNAIETRRWAHQHNFNSLIIVTSNWHMPRAMIELDHQLPDLTLIPYPVISEHMKHETWWRHPESVRLFIGEYLKYLFALVRFHFDPDTAV